MSAMQCALQLVEEEHCCGGLFIIVAMALLPLLHWPLCCPCSDGCYAGAVAVFAPVLLPSLRMHCSHLCAGIIAIKALAMLQLLHWHCHPLCCTGVVAIVVMVPLPLHRLLCLCCIGIIAIIALASLPLLHWRCHPQCAGNVVRPYPPATPQSAIGKGGRGGCNKDDKEEDFDGCWRMMGKAVVALAKRRRVQ